MMASGSSHLHHVHLKVRDLDVTLANGDKIINNLTFSVAESKIVGLAGESGSGKTTFAKAILGFTQGQLSITRGQLTVDSEEINLADQRSAQKLCGRRIAYVSQHPAAAMNPGMRIETLLKEMAIAYGEKVPTQQAISEVLVAVGLPDNQDFLRRYPHQLSGGQNQRVAIAIVLLRKPSVILLDEPTTGLDVLTKRQIAHQLKSLRDRFGVTLLIISHDLKLLGDVTDEIAVMQNGEIIERGESERILSSPVHPYTKKLVAAMPSFTDRRTFSSVAITVYGPLLKVVDMSVVRYNGGVPKQIVNSISFDLERSQCLAIVGASGSGKTTIARTLVGLQPSNNGSLLLDSRPLSADIRQRTLTQLKRIQYVPQDSLDALNPRHTVAESLSRPLKLYHQLRGNDLRNEIKRLLEMVRLTPAVAGRLPGTLSGGERQRVSIARALAATPEIIVCDEITSALDLSVQAAILELLTELKTNHGISLLFITHDLNVVSQIADEVLVLESGNLIEQGATRKILTSPEKDYTRRLIEAA